MRLVIAAAFLATLAPPLARADEEAPRGVAGDVAPRRPMPIAPAIKVGPPAEVAALGKRVVGRFTCKGNTIQPDGSSQPLVAKITTKLELDGAWIVTTLVETTSKLKWTEYRTYDATAKQWTRFQLVNTTASVQSTSLGEQNGTWNWTGTATSPQGTVQLRDHEQVGVKQRKLWGEALLAGTWQKTYEVTCTR